MAPGKVYFHNLDILRFLAALWVVGHHYMFTAAFREGAYESVTALNSAELFRSGYLGVCIFFVLSGFLITHVSEGTTFVRFAAARVFRLMPAFWICVIISTSVMVFLGASNGQQTAPISWAQGLAQFTMVPQAFGFKFVDGVYWTLVYEFVFYGWAAILIGCGLFHRHLLSVAALWLLISALNVFYVQSGILERLFVTYYSGAFTAGLLIWHLRRNGLTAANGALMVLSAVMLSTGVFEMAGQDYLPAGQWMPTPIEALLWSGFSIAVVLLALALPSLSAFSRWTALLGGMSYPLYLVHQELGYIALRSGIMPAEPLFAAVLLTVVMVGLAIAIHKSLETPLRTTLTSRLEPLVIFMERWYSKATGALTSRFATGG